MEIVEVNFPETTETYLLTETCRTCSRASNPEMLVSINQPDLTSDMSAVQIIEEFNFMNLKVAQNDGLPQQICGDCLIRLTDMSAFRRQCEKSQRVLESFVKLGILKVDKNTEVSEQKDLEKDVEEDNVDENTSSNYKDNTWNRMGIDEDHESDSPLEEIHEDFVGQPENNLSGEGTCEDEQNIEDEKRLTKAPLLMCNECGTIYLSRKELEKHSSTCGVSPTSAFKCLLCKEDFSCREDLQNHKNKKHPEGRSHICPICHRSFQSASNRNTHLQSHNKINSFQCDICNQGFKSKVYVNKHKKTVHTTGNYECPVCMIQFQNSSKFHYHVKSHNPNKRYQCKFCDKSFMQHHHLSNHERTHTGQKPYLCNVCGKDFKQECNFKLHLRIHSGIRPYVCNICGKDFAQRGSFGMHMRLHTGSRPYQCEVCGKNFIQKSTLTVHLRTHTGERPYKCDQCDRSFVQTHQLKYHKYSAHNGPAFTRKVCSSSGTDLDEVRQEQMPQPPFSCPLCSKTFKLPSSLTSHVKSHSEERKHVCTKCGNSFKRAEHLRIHVNGVHLKRKPYACDYCNKKFSQSGDRNIHMKSHTKEKPYKCSHCNKGFKLQKSLRAHERIHTGEKPFVCEICHSYYMTYNALAIHTMKHSVEENKELKVKTMEEIKSVLISSRNVSSSQLEDHPTNTTNMKAVVLEECIEMEESHEIEVEL